MQIHGQLSTPMSHIFTGKWLRQSQMDNCPPFIKHDQFIFFQAISFANPCGQLSNLHIRCHIFTGKRLKQSQLDNCPPLIQNDQIIFLQKMSYANPGGQLSNLHKMSYFCFFIGKWLKQSQMDRSNDQIIFLQSTICYANPGG